MSDGASRSVPRLPGCRQDFLPAPALQGCLWRRWRRWRQTFQLIVLASGPSEPGQLETNTGLLCLSGHLLVPPPTLPAKGCNDTACVAATAVTP